MTHDLLVPERRVMKIRKYEVSVDKLRWQCDPKMFDFECTKDLAPLRELLARSEQRGR